MLESRSPSPGHHPWRLFISAAVVFVATLTASTLSLVRISAAHEPDDFTLTEVFTGLHVPTAVEVAPTGEVFVIEKKGILKVFDGSDDQTADVVVDWRARTMQTGDQGMLGLAIDPLYGSGRNYVYVHYVLDEIPGENDPPHWGDSCPDTQNGCVVTATLARIEVDPATNGVVDTVDLLTGRSCLQFNGHSPNDLAFGPDGHLYLSVGDGAGYVAADYGQLGDNPCEDPPFPAEPTPANSEGGALRTMDLLTSTGGEAADPVWYNGVVLRVDADTGSAAPGNPLLTAGVPGDDRIIAHGLRNPWRIDFRPGTEELWIADVGWGEFEEINVVDDVDDGVVENFGWPCYEGSEPHAIYSSYGLCQTIINDPGDLFLSTTLTDARFPYDHDDPVGSCPGGTSAISGLAFASDDGPYPDEYDGALFFTDYARGCLWAMISGADGVPNPASIDTLATGVIIVDLDIAPDGSLWVVEVGDFSAGSGRIRRLDFIGDNLAPVAIIEASTLTGTENETRFEFDGTGSFDPEGGALTYEWDLDGDGAVDSTEPTAEIVYSDPGSYQVSLTVTDPEGVSGSDMVVANVSNTPPVVTISAPEPATTWRVGDSISFSATATDAEDGALEPDTPGQEWEWLLILHHCPDNDCHQHIEATWTGIDSGSFFTPDHEYPSWLELVVTVADSTGSVGSASIELQPETSTITVETEPAGLLVAGGVGAQSQASPVMIEAIEGGDVSLVAPTPQILGGTTYTFDSWSDGGPRIHDVVVPTDDTTITATFSEAASGEGFGDGWTAGNPTAPWSYWWNQGGPLGDPTGYVPLLWNGTYYDSDGVPGQPSDDEFAFGSIQPWGAHPGRGASQGGTDGRHAIIRYTVDQAGSHDINGSSITDLDCPSGGVELTVLVNNSVVSSVVHTGSAPGFFDQSLGRLAAGDTIDVALGPGDYDFCDATALDFFITRTDEPAMDVVADYRSDFSASSPSNGWSYLWNAQSVLGDSDGYAELQWNSSFYDTDGVLGGATPDPSSYSRAALWGVHPGRSEDQGAGFDRYVILRNPAPTSGQYAIVDSEITDIGCVGSGVEIAVLVDDQLISTRPYIGPGRATFDLELGYVTAGAAIDVAIGPGDDDVCDAVELDFSIIRTEGEPPTVVADFESQFGGPEPAEGWSYWWNAAGPVGQSGGYSPLQWNSIHFDSDGIVGSQSGDDFVYGLVAGWGVHPGRGTGQGTDDDRYAIARYTVSDAGSYAIADSLVDDRGCVSAGFELQIRVNDALIDSLLVTGDDPGVNFDWVLGDLGPGDTIDVAIGPDGSSVCDAVDVDYSISRS